MIRGKKCILRAVEENDLALLARWINDPELAGLVVGWSFPLSLAKQQEWFKNSLKETRTQRFIIESLDGEVIGLTGLWEIDWVNRNALTAVKLGEPKARGKGYGTDAVLTLMAYAFFEVNLNRLWTSILAFNEASYNTFVRKCGWLVEGLLRQEVYRHGRYHDLIRIGALKSDFLRHPRFNDYAPEQLREEPLRLSIPNKHRIQF